MGHQNPVDEEKLRQLFIDFVDAGLHGRFEEAISLLQEPYTGVGMGEQGIVIGKEQATLVLRGGYRPEDQNAVQYEVKSLNINFLSPDVAVVLGEVSVINTLPSGKQMHSGLMQTIGVCKKEGIWGISFTHASPTVLTAESIEAYPIRFMDHTISLLKAGLQAETVLYAEVNLTQNTIIRLEWKKMECQAKPQAHTLEEATVFGLYGKLDEAVEQEYYAFWNRLRLLGLFAEGVTKDHFDYRMRIQNGFIWMRSAVEMIRHTYSGDIMAVISYSSLDTPRHEYEPRTSTNIRDALTGVLNRESFENRAAEMLQDYDPQNNTALFMIDLDDFKQINDRLGHQMGDTVLRQVACVLQKTFRDTDAVGRIGGDEFMVMLTGAFSFAFLKKKADLLLDSMKLQMGGSKQIPVSVSIGIAYGRGRTTFEKLYRIADIALYTSKRAGKCRYHLINADTNAEQSYSVAGTNLLSLQTLLDFTDAKEVVQNRTPYEALIDNIPGSVLVITLGEHVKLIHCNDWTSRFTGYTQEEIDELQKEDALTMAHPDDLPHIQAVIQKIRDGHETTAHVVYRLRRKDGTYAHMQIDATMTERTKNEIIFYGIETSVEEVVQLKQQVEAAHNQLETMLNAIPSGVIVITLGNEDADTKIVHCNNWVSRFLGYSVEEVSRIETHNPLALVHPEDIAIITKAMEEMRAGATSINPIYRLLGKDGTYRHVRNNASLAECLPDKRIYYSVVTDVGEMIAMQNKLQYSRKQLEALLSAMPGGIAIFELTDTLDITFYGSWFYEFSGYASREEIEEARQGKNIATVWPDDLPKVQEAFRCIQEDGVDNFFISVRIKCKDGTPKWADIRAAVIERTGSYITMYIVYTDSAEHCTIE